MTDPQIDFGRVGGPRTVGADDDPRSFLNPYNFVSTPDRADLAGTDLDDHEPVGHHRVRADTYSGSIPITITCRTPLLLADQARSNEPTNETPRKMPTRVGRGKGVRAGKPLLLGSSVKGMLRTAYEAITNSRMGVVDPKLALPGAIRARAAAGLQMYPGYVTGDRDADDKWKVHIVKRLAPIDLATGSPQPMRSPWVPTKLGEQLMKRKGWRSTAEFDHKEFDAWIFLRRHADPFFLFWYVAALEPADELGDAPPAPTAYQSAGAYRPLKVRGRVHWTDSTFPAGGRKKRHERFVVTDILDAEADFVPDVVWADDSDVRGWSGVIESFRAAHEHDDDLAKYGSYVSDKERWKWQADRTLHMYERANGRATELMFTPAMIGREVFRSAPLDLIDDGHLPETDYNKLSPADRVFGWVADPDASRRRPQPNPRRAAHRGQLRVTAPSVSRGGVQRHGKNGIKIGVLNTPKTSQYRFYAGDKTQQPSKDGEDKSIADGFDVQQHRLRGRKFYLPHAETFDSQPYWSGSTNTANVVDVHGRGRYRDFIATPGVKNKVAVAVDSWVKPGTTFATTLHVSNLSATELGALLWLLALPDEASLGLGLGKPLGFGAVRVTAEWKSVRLFTGDAIRQRYRSIAAEPGPIGLDRIQSLVTDYDHLLAERMEPVRQEFLDAVFGFVGAPVHYPRLDKGNNGVTRPAPADNLYEWWVANESPSGGKRNLPPLGTKRAPTLPYNPQRPSKQG